MASRRRAAATRLRGCHHPSARTAAAIASQAVSRRTTCAASCARSARSSSCGSSRNARTGTQISRAIATGTRSVRLHDNVTRSAAGPRISRRSAGAGPRRMTRRRPTWRMPRRHACPARSASNAVIAIHAVASQNTPSLSSAGAIAPCGDRRTAAPDGADPAATNTVDVTTPPTSASFQNASRRDATAPQRVRSATNASAVNIAPCAAYVRSQVVRMGSISDAPCCVPDAADRRLPPASACASRATE
jgi:hypothetical protein